MNKRLILIFACICAITINTTQAQNNIRDKFLVEKVFKSDNDGWSLSEYFYDADNKLIKVFGSGYFFEQGQWRYGKGVRIFEYENGRVSKIIFKDSTHFMFDYDTHFFYNTQGQLIRSEKYMGEWMLQHLNYHYKDGLMVSTYRDGALPFQGDSLFYDMSGNVIRRSFWKGGPIWSSDYYEYDNNPKPSCGLDYILSTYLLPGNGDVAIDEMCLSKNNMTKMLTKAESRAYTYNEHGLPVTYEIIWDSIPTVEPMIFHITYKQVEVGVTEPVQELSEIKVYPNPTDGQLRITNRSSDRSKLSEANYELRIESIEVFDVYGRKVGERFPSNALEGWTRSGRGGREGWQPQAGGVVIDISHLLAGIYFVKVVTEKGEVIKKVVKQ